MVWRVDNGAFLPGVWLRRQSLITWRPEYLCICYAYAGANPVSYNDPTGRCPWCIAAGVGAAIGAYAGFVNGMENGETVAQASVDAITGAAAGAAAGIVVSGAGIVAIGAGAAAAATALTGVINGNGSWSDVVVAAVAGGVGAYDNIQQVGVRLQPIRLGGRDQTQPVRTGRGAQRVSRILCARHSMRTWRTYATQEKEPGGRCCPAEHSR